MVIKETTQVGNSLIRVKAKRVSNLKSKIVQKVVADLIDSMRYHELVGMAAPQIGKNLRIFVSEIRETKLRKGQSVKNADPLRVYINPEIIWCSKKQATGHEGCGSVASANIFGTVKRPDSVIIKAQDQNGDTFKIKASNLLARVIQHEYDHIEGIVFTDKANPQSYMSRNEYLNKFKK